MDDFAGRVDRFGADVSGRFDAVDQRFDAVERRFDQMATKDDLKRLEKRLDRWGQLMTGAVIAVASTLILRILGS